LTLDTYFNRLDDYSRANFKKRMALTLKLPSSVIDGWISGKKKVSPAYFEQVEKFTEGLVTRLDLRPDLFPDL